MLILFEAPLRPLPMPQRRVLEAKHKEKRIYDETPRGYVVPNVVANTSDL